MNYNKIEYEKSFGTSAQLPASDMPEIAFSGRSNVGKSSLINKLFNRKNLARVSSVCAEHNANVIDVTQSVMQKLFTMIMLIDISDLNSDFAALQSSFNALGEEIGMKIHIMHEDVFNSMHHI